MPSACLGLTGVLKNTASSSANCMSAAGTALGTPVTAAACNPSSPAQQMVMRSDLSIFNPASGLCLDVKGGVYAVNAPLQLYTCNGGASQKFTPPTAYPGTFKSALGTSCITGGATVAAGTPFGVNTCTSANQNWMFTPV
jgi:hypothetical protein